jgi:hypothetical protein
MNWEQIPVMQVINERKEGRRSNQNDEIKKYKILLTVHPKFHYTIIMASSSITMICLCYYTLFHIIGVQNLVQMCHNNMGNVKL